MYVNLEMLAGAKMGLRLRWRFQCIVGVGAIGSIARVVLANKQLLRRKQQPGNVMSYRGSTQT